MRSKILDSVYSLIVITLGCGLYAVGYTSFVLPNEIAPGGVTGIAAIIHSFFSFISVGSIILIINVPLFIIGYNKFKGGFIFKTVFATIVSSIFIDIAEAKLPVYTNDTLLAALTGGVLSGAGLALVMLRGASTGGAEIVAKFFNSKFKFISIGRIILLFDIIVVGLAALSFKNLETILYSIVYLFVFSVVMDKLLYGFDRGKLIYIITTRSNVVIEDIFKTVGRGVTKINAKGGYTDLDRTMIFCVTRTTEVSKVLQIVKYHDRDAFVAVSDLGEIHGLGFSNFE